MNADLDHVKDKIRSLLTEHGSLEEPVLVTLAEQSRPRVKAALVLLERAGEVHGRRESRTSPHVWTRGPAPAPEETTTRSTTRPAADASGPWDKHRQTPFAVRWTKHEDLVAHGRALLRAAGMQDHFGNNPDSDLDGDDATRFGILALSQTIVMTPSGTYFLAVPSPEGVGREYLPVAAGALEDAFAQAVRIPPAIWSRRQQTDDGEEGAPKSFRQVKDELGVLVRGWLYDGLTTASHIDRDQMFHLRCWELRSDIAPMFDRECDAFLRTWGDDAHTRICDWIAHAKNLHQPAPMLVLVGGAGDGKDTLAAAIGAQFRREGPVTGSIAVNTFNADVRNCPVVVSAEMLPSTGIRPGDGMSTAMFRDAITRSLHDVNEKNEKRVKLHGHLRWILTSNEKDFFPTKELLSADSQEAIARRLLVIEAPRIGEQTAPAKFLSDLGGFRGTSDWIDGAGRLVRHVRWIMTTHKIVHACPMGRFGVASFAPAFRDRLATSSRLASLIVDGLTRFVVGDPSRRALAGAVRVGGGQILVQPHDLHKRWSSLVSVGAVSDRLDARRTTPDAAVFAAEISERLSSGAAPVKIGGHAFRAIKVQLVLAYAAALGLDIERIKETIALPPAEFEARYQTRAA